MKAAAQKEPRVDVVQWGDDPIEVIVHDAPGDGETVVLTPQQAAALGRILGSAAERASRGERDHHFDDDGEEIP